MQEVRRLPEAGLVGSQAAEVLLSVVDEWKLARSSTFRLADVTGSRRTEETVVESGSNVAENRDTSRELSEGRS